jgi:hypothetical protein
VTILDIMQDTQTQYGRALRELRRVGASHATGNALRASYAQHLALRHNLRELAVYHYLGTIAESEWLNQLRYRGGDTEFATLVIWA